ncbi:MAG: hypothetical protein R8G33_10590 [Gammaproteobacteria bacterium]|nr:hypothetical protein [Gammaproteobacteria bacterium]
MKNLLASHGSPGSIAAEDAAIALCDEGDELDHLVVIPLWWANMTGDDWLNNGVSRNRYCSYLESELNDECDKSVMRVYEKCQQKNIHYHSIVMLGETEKLLQKFGSDEKYKKVIVGSHRPKYMSGLKDIMLTHRVIRKLGQRIEVIAHPYAC